MELRLYREDPILRETRHLPAGVYKLAHLLLAHADSPCVFVPIRSMQYLAVIDREEIVFVDRELPSRVQIAWQSFRRHERSALDERIEFVVAFHTRESLGVMPGLMSEFPPAMQALAGKARIEAPAAVLPFPGRQG